MPPNTVRGYSKQLNCTPLSFESLTENRQHRTRVMLVTPDPGPECFGRSTVRG